MLLFIGWGSRMATRCCRLSLCWWPAHFKSSMFEPDDIGMLAFGAYLLPLLVLVRVMALNLEVQRRVAATATA